MTLRGGDEKTAQGQETGESRLIPTPCGHKKVAR